jgi:hypothetical protein
VVKQTIRKKPDKITIRTKPKAFKKAFLQAFVLKHGHRALLLGTEILALVGVALVAVITALGQSAERFSGVGLWSSLVPFAGVVLVLAVVLFLAF